MTFIQIAKPIGLRAGRIEIDIVKKDLYLDLISELYSDPNINHIEIIAKNQEFFFISKEIATSHIISIITENENR